MLLRASSCIEMLYLLLHESIIIKDLTAGRKVHGLMMRNALEENSFLASHLIRMYALCGILLDADQVFKSLPEKTVFTWSITISSHAKLGQVEHAIRLYHQMRNSSVKPNQYVFVAVLKACANPQTLMEGKVIHSHITESDFAADVYIGSTLVDMYAKCGHLREAQRVLEILPARNVVTWNAMLAGYAQHGHGQEALQVYSQMQQEGYAQYRHGHEAFQLFQQMQERGLQADNVTFTSVLKACSSIRSLAQGKLVHAYISGSIYRSDIFVCSTLIDLYSKCGSLGDACRVFDNLEVCTIVTWNALMAGYIQHGHGQEALEFFQQMLEEGIEPDVITFLNMLKGCSMLEILNMGKLLHSSVIQSGFEMDLSVGCTLIDMYYKCGSLENACRVFEVLPIRNTVTWNAMISGYAQYGGGLDAFQLFQRMQQEGVQPDNVTLASMLKVCSPIVALNQGKLIHSLFVCCNLESDLLLCNTLIDMYCKCGSLKDACRVFNKLPRPDVVAWNTMIAGYAEHNDYSLALKCFQGMLVEGWKPDDVTYFCVLSACSHACLVQEACHYFKSMYQDNDIRPTVAHIFCMADLLSRAGFLYEAEALLQTMPLVGSHNVGWLSLLSHCRTHGDTELGRGCFDRVTTMDCSDASCYALMSKSYLDASMWVDASKIEELRKRTDAWKKPGKAFIEVGRKVHDFTVGDNSHPQSEIIYVKLRELHARIGEEGYVPHLQI